MKYGNDNNNKDNDDEGINTSISTKRGSSPSR